MEVAETMVTEPITIKYATNEDIPFLQQKKPDQSEEATDPVSFMQFYFTAGKSSRLFVSTALHPLGALLPSE